MKHITQTIFFFYLIVFAFASCKQKTTSHIRDDFKKYYDSFQVEGSFILFDENNKQYIIYNPNQLKQSYSPASTFKICNSLIGLETKVINDENFVIPWDSVTRTYAKWNTDHDLKTAFKNSTVWYYQEIARQVGNKQMKFWLDKAKYGNTDTSGGIDKFWLSGGLRISPEQQIEFLKKLKNNQLPFSQRSMDIVKNIMIAKDTLNYVVRAKTGFNDEDNKLLGWYIGYIEKDNNTYYFSNCILSNNSEHPNFIQARINITYAILNDLNVIKK